MPKTADFLSVLIDQHGAENVSVLGDSAGAGLAMAAVQELVQRNDPVPSRMVFVASWLDATVPDPLSQTSPLNGSLDGGSRRPRSIPGHWTC